MDRRTERQSRSLTELYRRRTTVDTLPLALYRRRCIVDAVPLALFRRRCTVGAVPSALRCRHGIVGTVGDSPVSPALSIFAQALCVDGIGFNRHFNPCMSTSVPRRSVLTGYVRTSLSTCFHEKQGLSYATSRVCRARRVLIFGHFCVFRYTYNYI